MMGKHTQVSIKISTEQPKAIVTHCQGHSWSLAVKSLIKECKILWDTICILIKYSRKQEKMAVKITDNIEEKLDEETIN